MLFADIHIHALFGADDGAQTEDEMFAMVDASYRDGVRQLCLTPHFDPNCFGDNRKQVEQAFDRLRKECPRRYPGLCIALGNELRYCKDCTAWLRTGDCQTLNGTQYVLLDFSAGEKIATVHRGLEELLGAGYVPILAHAERYSNLRSLQDLYEFRENGVLIQIDIQSLCRGFGWRVQRRCHAILREGLADFASSDAHNLTDRPPGFSSRYSYICRQYGDAYAEAICCKNAQALLFNIRQQKESG